MKEYKIDFIENPDSLSQEELKDLKGGKFPFCDCFCLINFGSNDEPDDEKPTDG